jgi:DNA-binding HxlR family transcriptional regulator
VSLKPVFPVEQTIRVLSNKWKPRIILILAWRSRRFSKLHAALPEVSHKVLIEHLRQLEEDGIVARQAKVGGYRRVHYSLTDAGLALLPILGLMVWWGVAHARKPTASRERHAPANRLSGNQPVRSGISRTPAV